MNIGRTIRIHFDVPAPVEEPEKHPYLPNPHLEPEEHPIRIDNWPIRKRKEVEVEE